MQIGYLRYNWFSFTYSFGIHSITPENTCTQLAYIAKYVDDIHACVLTAGKAIDKLGQTAAVLVKDAIRRQAC
jgi:hypothetical protein